MVNFNVLKVLAISLFVSQIASASSNYLGSAPERGVIISATPNKESLVSGESVTFKGTMKVIGKTKIEDLIDKLKGPHSKKGDLLEEFKKHGLDIFASFPSAAEDVSSKVILKGISDDEITFEYTSNEVRLSDINQFSIKLFNNTKDKEKLKKLSAVQAKLEKRLQLLIDLKKKYENSKALKEVIAVFEREIANLEKIVDRIAARINSDANLMAENTFPLIVDNYAAKTGRVSTVIGGYRFEIHGMPGNLIEGMSARFDSKVSFVDRDSEFNPEEFFLGKSQGDTRNYHLVEFFFNGKSIGSEKVGGANKNVNVVKTFDTDKLSASRLNDFEVVLSYVDYFGRKKKIGNLKYDLPVQVDKISPVWQASVPNITDRFTKALRPIDLVAFDSFGRIDEGTFKAVISGVTDSGISFNGDYSKLLSATKVGDGWQFRWSGSGGDLAEGEYELRADISDLKGNPGDPYLQSFRIDRTEPRINFIVPTDNLTNKYSYDLPIKIDDRSPTFTEIYVNEELFFGTAAKDFIASVSLNKEGVNTIRVTSTDQAGNKAEEFSTTFIRDTVPAQLALTMPVDGDFVNGIHFPISGSSNEVITSLNVNGQIIDIDSNGTSFSSSFRSLEEGPLVLSFTSVDKAGNTGEQKITVNVQLKALNESLIGLYYDDKNNKLIVRGAAGAVRPNLEVKVSSGFFSNDYVVADNRGAFELQIDPVPKVRVSVYDPVKDETLKADIVFGSEQDYILSGTVRDTSNKVLVGATVKIIGTDLVAKTDENGVFEFKRSLYPDVILTGDQQISVDGSTVVEAEGQSARQFSVTTIAITLGIKQSNILQNPIYLTPTYLDGSATAVSSAVGGTVVNENAPGVVLEIPPDATTFPTSKATELISMTTIPAEFSTVPPIPEAMPKTVVALEPSGTTFSKPVDLKLPNVNSFPAKTEMIIMLMNSKTGKWEIGGSAVVTEDGQSVQTKPNQGIRHFSLAYATIAGPTVMQKGAQDRPGADTFNGAVSTNVELPSFKIFNHDIAPKLIYKSAWAKPNVVVTNILDFPNKKVDVKVDKTYGSKVEKYTMDLVSCSWPSINTSVWCRKNLTDFYTNFQTETEYSNVKSEIQPDKVVANLKTGALKTESYTFKDLPRMANISFALDLVDPKNSSGYFESGIYPYQAHYDVHFKELIVGTSQTKYWNNVTDAQTSSPQEFSQTYDRLFTQDLTESLYVQNYRKSAVGTGWRLGGYQRILNPSGNKLVVEESDGQISTYSLKNTISTVLDGETQGFDVKKGVGLNRWPAVAIGGKDKNELLKFEINQGQVLKTNLGKNYSLTGTIAGFDFYNYDTQSCYSERYCSKRISGLGGNVCVEYSYRQRCNNVPNSYCSQHSYPFDWASTASQLILGSSSVLGVDSSRHAFFQTSSQGSNKLFGREVAADTFENKYATQVDSHDSNVRTFCSSKSGLNCGQASGLAEAKSGYNQCGAYPASTGKFPSASDEIDGLNTPMGLIPGIVPETVVIADTGNHRVKEYNISTGQIRIIAGNGATVDSGDGLIATDAAVPHPQGLAYDSKGNLYISSKTGFIRKVDSNGFISTLAGDPVNGKFSHESPASEMLFNNPYGLVVDSAKNFLYVADNGHNRIVRIDLLTNIASTIAGNGTTSFSGDGGSALEAGISAPTLLGLDSNGNLLVVDSGNNKIRQILFQNVSGGVLAFDPTADDHSKMVRHADGQFARTMRDGTVLYYNNQGYQISSSDRVGRATVFNYDAENNLLAIMFPNGQSIEYSYSGGKLRSITDIAGRETTLSYDFSGNLKAVHLPDESIKKYEYNDEGLLVVERDQENNPISYEYNAQSRLKRVIASDGAVTVVNDLASSNLQNYDPSKPNTPSASGVGDGMASDSVVDPNGNTTELAKDFQGYISTIVDAKGNKTTIKRDSKGRAIEISAPNGNVTKTAYNQYGDIIRTEDVSLAIVEQKEFDQWGQLTKKIDAKGGISEQVYTPTGLLTAQIAQNGSRVEYTYNQFGLIQAKKFIGVDGQSEVRTLTYDSLGRVIKETQSDGKYAEFELDAAGNLIKSRSIVDSSRVAETIYSYDVFNRLVKVVSSEGEVIKYEYTKLGDLSKIVDPKGRETLFNYDSRRRLTTKVDATGEIYSFTYDKNGNVISEVDPKGQVRTYAYNELNKMVQAQFPDDFVSYVYNKNRELLEAQNSLSKVTYQRDSRDRVTSAEVEGLGELTNYPRLAMNSAYDVNGNRTELVTSVGSVAYHYDMMNRLVGLETSSGSQYGFDYDGLGRLKRIQRPGSQIDYIFSGQSLSQMIHSSNGVTKSFVEYAYDERKFPISKRSPAGLVEYAYDLNGQLKAASGSANEVFSYDALGNRVSDHNGSFNYDQQTQRLTEDWQYFYNYDKNGNLLQKIPKDVTKNAWLYHYSSKNQLIKVQLLDKPLGAVIRQVEYRYDVLGRRLQKSVWTKDAESDPKKTYVRKYVYDGDNIFAEFDGNNRLLGRYTHSPLSPDDVLEAEITNAGASSGLAQNDGKYFYLKDVLGSVTDISNEDGQIVQRYDYESFGKIRSIKTAGGSDITSSPIVNTSFTYTGREWDDEAGLYYYRARYYDANVGRFIQQDPHPGKLKSPETIVNKYSYVLNMPTIATDPSGKFIDFFMIMGALTGSFGKEVQRAAVIGTAFAAAFVGGPLVASALLGASAGAATFALVSAIAGTAIGGVIGGLGYTSTGLGTFGDGFKVGAAAGLAGGLAGGIGLYGSRQEFLDLANDSARQIMRPFTKLFGSSANFFPLSSQAATTATFGMAGFSYDQLKQSCDEGYSYDWKSNKCQPSSIDIPLPTPTL